MRYWRCWFRRHVFAATEIKWYEDDSAWGVIVFFCDRCGKPEEEAE